MALLYKTLGRTTPAGIQTETFLQGQLILWDGEGGTEEGGAGIEGGRARQRVPALQVLPGEYQFKCVVDVNGAPPLYGPARRNTHACTTHAKTTGRP